MIRDFGQPSIKFGQNCIAPEDFMRPASTTRFPTPGLKQRLYLDDSNFNVGTSFSLIIEFNL